MGALPGGTVGSHLNDTDWLSEASGGTVTEVEIATHGAQRGILSGIASGHPIDSAPAGRHNIVDILKREIHNGTVYGSVSLHSPREQETTMYVGGDRGARVWLNGEVDLRKSQ